MRFSTAERRAKLVEIEGYDGIEDLAQAILSDSVSPAICMKEDCDFTCEKEPDQDAAIVKSAAPIPCNRPSPSRTSSNSTLPTFNYEVPRPAAGAFLMLDFGLQAPPSTWRFS